MPSNPQVVSLCIGALGTIASLVSLCVKDWSHVSLLAVKATASPFKSCLSGGGHSACSSNKDSDAEATAAFAVIGFVLAALSVLALTGIAFNKLSSKFTRWVLFGFCGATICTIIAMGIWTHAVNNATYGAGFAMCIVAWILLLVTTVYMFKSVKNPLANDAYFQV